MCILQVIGNWCRSKTCMERVFVIIFVVICILIIIFAATGGRSLAIIPPTCNTSLCLNEASKILRYRNDAVDHCKNFHSFVCGNFLKSAERSEKLSLAEFQKEQLLQFYKADIRNNDHQMVKSAKKLFKTCLDQREKEMQQLTTLKAVLKKAGGWPVVERSGWDETAYNWTKATYTLRKLGYPFRIFMDLTIEPDQQAENSYIFKTATPDTTDNLYALSEKDKVELMTEIALEFGAQDKKDTLKQMQDVHDFWKKLNQIQYPANSAKPFERVKAEDFQRNFEFFNLIEFNNLIIGHPYELARQHYHLFPPATILLTWLNVIAATPKRTQANYMMWKIVEQTIPYMHCELRAGKAGIKKLETFEEFCMKKTEEKFVLSPIRFLIDRKYLPKQKRDIVNKLLGSIKDEFVHMLQKSTWVEENDREKLVQRVTYLAFVIGRPDDYFGDDKLDLLEANVGHTNQTSFMDLVAQANRHYDSNKYHQYMIARSDSILEKRYIDNEEPEYIKEQNTIYIPGSVIQKFFHEQKSNYLNYGKIGATLAFHFGAVIADAMGRSNWSGNTKEEFEKDVICFENELFKCIETTTITSALCLQRTLNLAQHTIGLKMAYAAYTKWQKKNEDFPLIATNYTQNQLFWTAAAITSCQKTFFASCPRNVNEGFRTDDQHELKKVFVSIAKNYQFATDFNCPTISADIVCKLL